MTVPPARAKRPPPRSCTSPARRATTTPPPSAATQKLVDTCQAKDGREFGACVSDAAQQPGADAAQAAQAAEHGQGDAHRSDNAPAAGRGQSGR